MGHDTKYGTRYDGPYHWRKQLVWGLLIIAVGTLLLLDRTGLMDIDLDLARLWRYWPWLLVVLGVTQMIPPTTARQFTSGLWNIFFAAWWYCSFERIGGYGFGDTWPALLIAWGVCIVLRPVVGKIIASNQEAS